ncbi:MAG: glucosamine-6-phosphate deaminase [Gemmatimonadota bacterium]
MISTERERITTAVIEDHRRLAAVVAERIATLIRTRNAARERAVLGLATGSTPLGVYRELIRLHHEEELDFSNVVSFNLDEYYPMDPGSPRSYHRYMWENLFEHVNVRPENVHIPPGNVPREAIDDFCREYESAISRAGGIDLQILGIGRTGHIGFNEPGSGRESRTRLIYLDTVTRRDAAGDFFGEDNVPLEAITMGVATILEAREIALLATGQHKARIVRRAVEGPVDSDVAATYLQEHPQATVFADLPAAAELTRIQTPWLLGEVEWTRERETRAVVWLSEQAGKSILRLETKDYRDHHLSPLVARWGSAGPLNGEGFNALIAKIRGKSKLPRGKRIVVFSPHPDDDVISMGGILHKLQANGNQIVVAYQTSGNVAVFDYEVRRYLDFLRRIETALGPGADALDRVARRVEDALDAKLPGEVDLPEVQQMKRAVREAEAISAIETLGLSRGQACFLDLPFYRTGTVRKEPVGERDVEIVGALLEDVRPEIVFVAGEFSDPHGTHRMCKEATDLALARYAGPSPEVWLYSGAWEEWPVTDASVLVPLSEEELRRKIQAIFKHESQKDEAPFPGPDEREFWQRVESRNRGTAAILERLGLPAYFAMEAYIVERGGRRVTPPLVPTSSLGSEVPSEGEAPVLAERS